MQIVPIFLEIKRTAAAAVVRVELQSWDWRVTCFQDNYVHFDYETAVKDTCRTNNTLSWNDCFSPPFLLPGPEQSTVCFIFSCLLSLCEMEAKR